MKLYDLTLSGNCYKVRLFAALAHIDLELVAVDLAGGEHRQAPFMALNPLGQVPVLQDGKRVLRDAQAILVHLAGTYGGLAWWPGEAVAQAQIVQWLSFAANEVQHSVATARLIDLFGYPLDKTIALEKSAHVLAVLDDHLQAHDWLAIGRPTIAECAVYPYVALAPDGGVDLQPYPQVRRWLARVEALPGYLPKP